MILLHEVGIFLKTRLLECGFSINLYGTKGTISFDYIANLYLCETIDACYDQSNALLSVMGTKDDKGEWNTQGHPDRIIHIGRRELALFAKLFDGSENWKHARLPLVHSNYQSGGRIYVNEMDDCLTITNPGVFIPGSIREVLRPGYNPPYYRNALLASAMANFRMIDTATSGIKKVFLIQKERFFPMPDYEMVQSYQVTVTVYGKTLNDQYTHILFDHPELDLETIYLLDQVQKGKTISDSDLHLLQKQKLIRIEDQQIYLNDGGQETDKGTETDTKTNLSAGGQKETNTKEDNSGGIKDSEGKKEDDSRGIKDSEGKKEDEGRGIKDSEGKKEDENRGIKGTEDDALQMKLSSSEIHMIEILKEQPQISILKLADAMELSPKGTRIILDRLKIKGFISREGGRKYGKWIVQCPARE